MSGICAITGRSGMTGNSRSKSNVATKRRQKVNLQKVKINGKSVLISTRAMRTMFKKPR